MNPNKTARIKEEQNTSLPENRGEHQNMALKLEDM